MKVVIVQNYYDPYILGGAEIAVEKMINSLLDNDIQVILVTTRCRHELEMKRWRHDLKVYRFFPKNIYFSYPPGKRMNSVKKMLWWIINLWNPFTYFYVRNIFKKEKPDLVNIHNYYSLSPSVFTAAKSLKIPILYTAHDFFPLCKNSSFIRNNKICIKQCIVCKLWSKWNHVFLKRIKYVFLSEFSKKTYSMYFKAKGDVLHNPVFISKKQIEINMGIKREQRKQRKNITFLFLGRLDHHKGIKTLLMAFGKLENKDVSLLICGDGVLRSEVETCAKRDSRIKYLGFVEGDRKKEIILNSDVFVFPSECYEMSPLTIQEAYGNGLPVIGTDLGSIPEFIESGNTGYVFGYKDFNGLKDILDEVSLNKQSIDIMSEKCFEKALENLNTVYVEKLINIYKSEVQNVH